MNPIKKILLLLDFNQRILELTNNGAKPFSELEELKMLTIKLFGKESNYLNHKIDFSPMYVGLDTSANDYKSAFEVGKKKLSDLVMVMIKDINIDMTINNDADLLNRYLIGIYTSEIAGSAREVAKYLNIHLEHAEYLRDELIKINKEKDFFITEFSGNGDFFIVHIKKHKLYSYLNEGGFKVASSISKQPENHEDEIQKVFISHSSKDKVYVELMINLLEDIGLKSSQIFCTSLPGYGIDLSEDFLMRIKTEINDKVLVLFILSENFYNSPVSMCEMGATWVKSHSHIPILIPPFQYSDIKGVIPNIQGFKINEKDGLNQLKENLEVLFFLEPIKSSIWERKRDNAIRGMNLLIK